MVYKLCDIDIELKYKNVKRLSIKVNRNGQVSANVPLGMPIDKTENFITAHQKWIRKHLVRFANERKAMVNSNQYYNGDIVELFGEKYVIKVEYINSKAMLGNIVDKTLIIKCSETATANDRKALVAVMYKNRLIKYLHNRFFELCKLYDELPPPSFTVKNLKSRWGSCRPTTRSLTFNLALAQCPTEIIDYVIIHELCHLSHCNHSDAFWNLVQSRCDNYKEFDTALKNYPIFKS